MLRHVDDFTPLAISNIAYAFAVVGAAIEAQAARASHVNSWPLMPKFLGELQPLIVDGLGTYGAMELSIVAWAYASTGLATPEFFDVIEEEVLRLLPEFTTQAHDPTELAVATTRKCSIVY